MLSVHSSPHPPEADVCGLSSLIHDHSLLAWNNYNWENSKSWKGTSHCEWTGFKVGISIMTLFNTSVPCNSGSRWCICVYESLYFKAADGKLPPGQCWSITWSRTALILVKDTQASVPSTSEYFMGFDSRRRIQKHLLCHFNDSQWAVPLSNFNIIGRQLVNCKNCEQLCSVLGYWSNCVFWGILRLLLKYYWSKAIAGVTSLHSTVDWLVNCWHAGLLSAHCTGGSVTSYGGTVCSVLCFEYRALSTVCGLLSVEYRALSTVSAVLSARAVSPLQ